MFLIPSTLFDFREGYGDLAPTSDASRVFVICFALYGIIILGIFLGIVGEFIIERHEENVKRRTSKAQTMLMEKFADDEGSTTPEQRSFFQDLMYICIAEAPIILILVVLGTPIVYLEGWDAIMG